MMTRPIGPTMVALALLLLPACGTAQATDLVPALQRLADSGDAEAIYHLGMFYQTGTGVTEDHAKALAAFRRAAAAGDPLGAYKLGCYYDGQGAGLIEPDAEQALKWKLVAARAGYALAQQDVAAHYARRGDTAAALAWLEKSAAQGWSGALMALASVYNGMTGVAPDPARTAAYFRLFVDRTDANEQQRQWVAAFEAKLSSADRDRAAALVRDYRPAPTPLTVKALSGQRAAAALVAAHEGLSRE